MVVEKKMETIFFDIFTGERHILTFIHLHILRLRFFSQFTNEVGVPHRFDALSHFFIVKTFKVLKESILV